MHNVLKFSTEVLAVTPDQSGLSLKCQDRRRKCRAKGFSFSLNLPIILLPVTTSFLLPMVAPKNLRGSRSISKTSTQPTQGRASRRVHYTRVTLWQQVPTGWSCQIPTSNTETHFWNCKIRYYVPRWQHTGIRKGCFSTKKDDKELTNKGTCGCTNVARQSNSWAVRMLFLNYFPEKNLQRGSGGMLLSDIHIY